MKKYIITLLLVLAVEIGILFGISTYFDFNLLSTMFFGSLFFVFIAFFTSSSGDIFTKNSEAAVLGSMAGRYTPKHTTPTLKVGPFLLGSVLCVVVYFGMAFFMG
ncbi:hypothetical protein M3936_07710 [Sutcliffiella horikoshii]|uniref:hypothetical protein n=1 Tax=Sutcliffiella horikoshii TaxID=79883 RepID=UPI0007D0B18D|nr:hypothetical protein [Sutcliffiella horikoshii]MCM3617461.1 hypothetical protein [Sutcliffiella horikoshii]